MSLAPFLRQLRQLRIHKVSRSRLAEKFRAASRRRRRRDRELQTSRKMEERARIGIESKLLAGGGVANERRQRVAGETGTGQVTFVVVCQNDGSLALGTWS